MVSIRGDTFEVWEEYSGRIKNYVPLTREQEYEFGEDRQRVRDEIEELVYLRSGMNGDAASVNLQIRMGRRKIAELEEKFLKQNMNLLFDFGCKYHIKNPWVDKDVLFSALSRSLLASVRKFVHTKGYKFSTYGVRGMEMATKRVYANHRKKWGGYVYLGDKLPGEEGGDSFGLVEDRKSLTVCGEVERDEWRKTLERVIVERLDSREQTIIRLRFGLTDDGRVYTLGQIGDLSDIHVTRERVRQIEVGALKKLKIHSHIQRFAPLLNGR